MRKKLFALVNDLARSNSSEQQAQLADTARELIDKYHRDQLYIAVAAMRKLGVDASDAYDKLYAMVPEATWI